MRSEKVLIVSQNKGLVNQARMLLREAGISIVTVIDTPARALSALWGDTPDITLLDLGGHRSGMMDILPVILGSGRALATMGSIGISGYRATEGSQWDEERDMLAGLGVSHCLPADSPPAELQTVLQNILDSHSAGTAKGAVAKKTRMLLFLNDRNRSHAFHQAMQGKPVLIDDAIEVEALCRAFLDNTPDLVLIDPRGLGSNLATIGNVARHFPAVRIYYIVPADVSTMWASRAAEFVTRVIEYPDDVAGYRRILTLAEETAGPAHAAPNAPAAVTLPPPPPVPKKVMVVDDDVAVRTMMIEFLKHFGYDTMEAEDGRMALDMLRREQPDLLISDIYMPRMNGFQLFMEVRNNWPNLPVVLITGYNSAAKEMAAYSIKDADFLEKPFELATVEALVRSKLNRAAS